ncbi:MAG TPA: ABC transporter permease subunit [Gaiellaceae bacterium]|nr:ABC transporter permease subunit [Gaiellaceae bacterium]
MNGAAVIVAYAIRESVRRRIFIVVLLLTLAFLALYGLGVRQAFSELDEFTAGSEAGAVLDSVTVAGTTLFGLSIFATLFLGAVLAVFLTLNVVRGDAERGLLQPLVVRPVGRTTLLLARFGAAAGVCAAYVWIVFTAALLITHGFGDGWWPDRFLRPALALGGAVVLVVGLSVLGSALFSGTANGIAIFMLFGGGLVAGLLGQIGEALGSSTLERVATVSSWILPFEALYQEALHQISADSFGLTRVALQLGPFGGAEAGGVALWLYAAAYLGAVLGLALLFFSRRDL